MTEHRLQVGDSVTIITPTSSWYKKKGRITRIHDVERKVSVKIPGEKARVFSLRSIEYHEEPERPTTSGATSMPHESEANVRRRVFAEARARQAAEHAQRCRENDLLARIERIESAVDEIKDMLRLFTNMNMGDQDDSNPPDRGG